MEAGWAMVPADHLFATEGDALPALAIVRQPNGSHHFGIFWRRHGNWIQVMDPAVGRRWVSAARIRNDIYVHTQEVPADGWREWTGTDSFLRPLAGRIRRTGAKAEPLMEAALGGLAPSRLARLAAATRMTASLQASGALRRGPEGRRFLAQCARAAEPI